MIVYAQVNQGFSPILGANVTAIIEPESGDPIILDLFDNGAGNICFYKFIFLVIADEWINLLQVRFLSCLHINFFKKKSIEKMCV